MKFRDFNVQILAEREDGFDVRIVSDASGELSTTFTMKYSIDELLQMFDSSDESVRRNRKVVVSPDPNAEPPTNVGQELFEMLFSAPEVNRAFGKCIGDANGANAGVRFKLTMNTKDEAVANLARLPWELLHDKSEYKYFGLRPDTPIVRYLQISKQYEVKQFRPPLRILVVSSNPREDLDLERERKNIEQALGDNPKIELDFLKDATIDMIDTKLATAKREGRGHHVLHYMGHGDFHGGKGVLLLNGSGGGVDYVDGATFNTALQASGTIRLVFLNACNTAQSGGQAGSDPFSGVAAALVFEGLPAVVAMQRPIPDEAAIVLSKSFYPNIAEGWPIDGAISSGRRQVAYASRGTLDWAIPVLFMRSPDGALFSFLDSSPKPVGPTPPDDEPERTTVPEPLSLIVATDDQADQVEMTTTPLRGQAGHVRVCLQVETESGWWKGIGINEREPTLEGERRDGLKCTTITPSRVDVAFWKAKIFGVHTYVGTRSLDLRPYKDHEVMFTWKKD